MQRTIEIAQEQISTSLLTFYNVTLHFMIDCHEPLYSEDETFMIFSYDIING